MIIGRLSNTDTGGGYTRRFTTEAEANKWFMWATDGELDRDSYCPNVVNGRCACRLRVTLTDVSEDVPAN